MAPFLSSAQDTQITKDKKRLKHELMQKRVVIASASSGGPWLQPVDPFILFLSSLRYSAPPHFACGRHRTCVTYCFRRPFHPLLMHVVLVAILWPSCAPAKSSYFFVCLLPKVLSIYLRSEQNCRSKGLCRSVTKLQKYSFFLATRFLPLSLW